MEILKLTDESMLLNISLSNSNSGCKNMGQELTSDLLEITLRSL